MEAQILLLIVLFFFYLIGLRKGIIDSFKIGYYEQKLKNRGVDISGVENIGLIDIWRIK